MFSLTIVMHVRVLFCVMFPCKFRSAEFLLVSFPCLINHWQLLNLSTTRVRPSAYRFSAFNTRRQFAVAYSELSLWTTTELLVLFLWFPPSPPLHGGPRKISRVRIMNKIELKLPIKLEMAVKIERKRSTEYYTISYVWPNLWCHQLKLR